MEFVKTGAGSGNILDVSVDAALTGDAFALDMNLGIAARGIFIDCGAGARTGADIQVNDDSTGAHSVIDINSSGSGATVGFDFVGSFNGSPGGQVFNINLNANDNLDTEIMQLTTGAGNRGIMFDFDLGHTDSGTTSHIFDVDITGVFDSNFLDIAYGDASTGNAIFINLDNALAATGLHIEGSGVRTQPMVEIITDSTSSASLIDISVDGAITGTAAIDIDMNAGLAANAIFIDAGNGIRTANLIDVTHDGSGNIDVLQVTASNTGSGSVFDINVTGAGSGAVMDVALSTTSTGAVFNIDMDAAVGAPFLTLDYGNGIRTEDMCQVTFDGSGTNPFWDINITNTGAGGTSDYWDIDVTGVYTGSILDINYGAAATGDAVVIAMGSAVAASALTLSGAGARTDDLIKIDDSGTGSGHIFDINFTGIYTGNCLDITYATAAATGNAIDLNMGTNLAGNAININLAGARTESAIVIDGTNSDGGTDDHVIDINQTGILDSNVLDITFATAVSTGNAIDLNMGTNVAGMAVSVSSAGTGVSGEGVCFDVAHTGDLVAGADAVRISSTGSPSATSNLLAVEQSTGAGTAGAFAVYISATGTNVEALKVDDGNVVFDEALTVSGATTLDTVLYKDLTETVAAANVITAAETGSVFFLNSVTEFASTLPAPAAGLHFTFIVTAAPSGANYTITTNASANIILGTVHESSGGDGDSETSGADTINFVDSVSVVGDTVEVWCDGTNWFAKCFCDAAGGITITTAT
jgi:hypothetical protein